MKTVKNNLGILSLFLAVMGCSLPALAMESPAPSQGNEPRVAQTNLLQLGAQLQSTNFDCSHLVHSLYERVGLHYQYATSRTLYRGVEEFQRVLQPISGDVVVWRGHMGIVVDPAKHSFLSALRTHVKTSSYISGYWKHRGPLRFFRFAPSVERPNQ
jgi:cell wall-associated NlpC family hydrolase